MSDEPEAEQEISTNQALLPGDDRRLAKVPPQLRAHAFKPGESGNPGGLLKGSTRTLSGMVKQALADGATDEIIAEKIVEVLQNPNHRHWLGTLREAWDRLEGKASDHKNQLHKQIKEGITLQDGRGKDPVPLPLDE